MALVKYIFGALVGLYSFIYGGGHFFICLGDYVLNPSEHNLDCLQMPGLLAVCGITAIVLCFEGIRKILQKEQKKLDIDDAL